MGPGISRGAAPLGAEGTGPRAVASRRRGADLEEALLEAAWQEVSEVGYGRLTMEGVAARARTSRAVLYRRWPNRAALVLAVMRRQLGSLSSEIPDTGTLRGDVLSVLRHWRRRYHQMGPDIIHGLMTDRQEVPESASEIVLEVMLTILRRAAKRGEVRLDAVTPRIASLPVDLLRHRLLLTRSPASDAFLAEIVDDVFLALVARSEPSPGGRLATRRPRTT